MQYSPSRFPPAPARSPSTSTPAQATDQLPPWGFLEWFLIMQTALGALSFIPGSGPFRIVIRILPFVAALLPFFFHKPFRKTRIPVQGLLIGVIGIYAVSFFHPQTNTVMAGLATVTMTICIIAPAFWAPQMIYGPRQIRRLLVILLVVYGLDSGLGILQVYYPERFIPRDMLDQMEELKSTGRVYEGADGREIMRPPGLSTNAGTACASGMIGGLLGVAFLLGRTSMLLRIYCIVTIFLGTAVIYVSMIRTSLLVLCGMCVVLCILNFMQGRVGKGVMVIAVAGAGCVAGLIYAISLGGDAVQDRYATIVEQSPGALYYNSRGAMVERTFRAKIFDYPLGAGLARWGQMRGYFGDETNSNSTFLFSEVQLDSWVLDGGIVLLLIYGSAIVFTILSQAGLARFSRVPELGSLAAIICAVSCGIASMCFSFVPFASQFGIIFWLLAGTLYGASKRAVALR